MNRRLTSFLVGALAAVLLGVPAQAQDWTKKAVGLKSGKLVENVQKREHHATDNVAESPEFRKLSVQEQEKAMAEIQKREDAGQPVAIASKNAKQLQPGMAKEYGTDNLLKGGLTVKRQAMRAPFKASDETVDANGLIVAPAEGEHKFYSRQGGAWFNNSGSPDMEDQSGYVEIVECADGTIYVKDIISHSANGTWVKGTKQGNTITIPMAQPVSYSTNYGTTLSIYWGAVNDLGTEIVKDATVESITFNVDGDVATLQGSDQYHFVTIFWDDDNSWTGYADYETVWTYDPTYVPASTELVTPPASLEASQYYVVANSYTSAGASKYKSTANVGFDGNDVYVQGLFKDFPEAWIKGSLEGNLVTFPKFQFQGVYAGSYNIWLIGVSYDEETESNSIENFYMIYDAEAKTLTSVNDAVANAAEDRIYYLTWLGEIVISTEAPGEDVAETGAPVDTLPYANAFDSDDEIADMGILDSNDDGKTWAPVGGAFRYTYNSNSDADDWLVAPAVLLEVGKKYAVSIDARCGLASYPERIEVKMGKEAKASAFTEQVIPATDVVWVDAQTLTSEAFAVAETGYYFFGIHAISDADNYYLYADNLLIEAVAEPTAPAAITDLTVVSFENDQIGATVTFTAPATAVNGSALTENLTKIELYRDGKIINVFEDVAPGTKIEFIDQVDLTLGAHKYQAIPYNANGVGQKSEVVDALIITILNVPYTADLSDAGVFSTFTVIDANEDGKTWTLGNDGAGISYNSSLDADDYLISLPIQLTAGQRYSVIANMRCASASYPERFEILVGKEATPEALTIKAIAPTTIVSTDYEEYEGEFTVAEDGTYYVAVHGISDADMYTLYISSLTVEMGLPDTAAAAPRISSVQPDPYGADKAVITVMAPGYDISGNKLTEPIAALNIYRNGDLVKSFENVRPQDTKVYVDFVDNSGVYTYQAVPYDAAGNRGKKSDKEQVYIGLDVPAPVENAVAAEGEDGLVLLTWDPVTEGLNGGVVVPNEVEYEIWTGHEEDVLFWTVLVLDDKIGSTTDNYYVVETDEEQEQTIESLYILPRNAMGTPDEDYATGVNFYAGAAHSLPFEEHFASTGLNYDWLIYDSDGGVDFGITSDASDEDGGALTTLGTGDGDYAAYTPGKVSVGGGNPTLIFDVKGDGSFKNQFKVIIQTPDANQKTISIVVPGADYQTVKVSLAEFANDEFIKPIFVANFKEEGLLTFDNVKISDLLEYNLAASVEAPKSVLAGNAAKLNVAVKNIGERVAEGYTVKLYVGEEEVLSEKVAEGLASFATKVISFDYPTTIFTEAGDVTVRAEVEYDIDLDDEDNVAETVFTVKQSSAPKPENLTAEKTADGVKLTWDAPSSSTEQVTESFEDTDVFVPFSLGGITADNQYGAFGDWTLYDGNNTTVYGFSSLSFENMGEPQAWQVFTPAAVGVEDSYAPHSGDQFVWSFCPADESGTPAADHWLISPELPGIAQTISFYYRAITDQYGAETFEVLYSTTDNKPSSFTKVQDFSTTATEWTEASVDLPAGTTYFAIRHTAQDIFGLLIDDVTFARGGGSVAKFNVYVNRSLYDDTTATSLEVKNVTAGEFAVTTVMASGAESAPVIVVIDGANQQPTAIEQIIGRQQAVDVYTLDGRLVRQQTTDLRGLKGAYVIEGQKVILK